MRTIIMHFYNEEYLLPWWLKHHKKYFDHGILIDYHSTDNSVEICKEICPTWEIVKTKNNDFNAIHVDREIMEIEKSIQGWRIALTTTEFLIGNYNLLNTSLQNYYVIKSYIMADYLNQDQNTIHDDDLIKKHYHGYHDGNHRKGRLFNSIPSIYNTGRHFIHYNTEDFAILWYAFAPWTEKTKQRKLQIQTRIPESNFRSGLGCHHSINYDQLEQQYFFHAARTSNMNDFIEKLIVDK